MGMRRGLRAAAVLLCLGQLPADAQTQDPAHNKDIIARRAETVVTCDDLPPCTLHAQHFLVRAVAGAGRVQRRVEAVVWVAGGEPRVSSWRPLAP